MDKRQRYQNYMILANEFLCREEYERALHSFQKAYRFVENGKEKTDVLYEIADILLILDCFQEAKEKYEEILHIDAQQPGAYYGLSLTNEFLKGEVSYSIAYYQKAIEIDPDYDRAYYYLGHLYDKIGQTQKAKECFECCIALDPYDYVTYNDLGSLYETQEEYDKALELVEQSLSIHPTYGRALFNMGVIYHRLGNDTLAMEYYHRAIDEFDSPYLFLNMSAIYIAWKEYEEAIEVLDFGMERFEDSVNLHYNKACCLSILGREELALLELKRAMEIEPEALQWARGDADLSDLVKEFTW